MSDEAVVGMLYSLFTGVGIIVFLFVSFFFYHRRVAGRRQREMEYRDYCERMRPDLLRFRSNPRCPSAYNGMSRRSVNRFLCRGITNPAFHPDNESTDERFGHPKPNYIFGKHGILFIDQKPKRVFKTTHVDAMNYSELLCESCRARIFQDNKKPTSKEAYNKAKTKNCGKDEEIDKFEVDAKRLNECVNSFNTNINTNIKSHAEQRQEFKKVEFEADVHSSDIIYEINEHLKEDSICTTEDDFEMNPYYSEINSAPPNRRQSMVSVQADTGYGALYGRRKSSVFRLRQFSVEAPDIRSLPVLENEYYDNVFESMSLTHM
ncbi:uncharacterized protein LOC127848076 [Dreissena polymorpha]|nr:uncharacterized protein LOC127848076 [Dreissena polymorpha]